MLEQGVPLDEALSAAKTNTEEKLAWDAELAALQASGMPFEEALARMRARADGATELPELTAQQIAALADDQIHKLAMPMLEQGVPLDEALSAAKTNTEEKLAWDAELAALQASGMPFEEALA